MMNGNGHRCLILILIEISLLTYKNGVRIHGINLYPVLKMYFIRNNLIKDFKLAFV